MNIELSQSIFRDFLRGNDFYFLWDKYDYDYNLLEFAIRINLTSLPLTTPLIGLEILIEFLQGQSIHDLSEKYRINPFGIQKILRDSINNLTTHPLIPTEFTNPT